MEKKQIREKIIQILSREDILIDFGNENSILDDNDDLATYGLDSFAFIKLLVELEQEFKIEIPNELLIFQNWDTIEKIVVGLLELSEGNL